MEKEKRRGGTHRGREGDPYLPFLLHRALEMVP